MREAEFNLKELRKAAKRARKQLEKLPEWEKQAIREISDAAASDESREALRKIREQKINEKD